MDVQFLHTGEPVLVIEEGSGEPGGYRRDATGRDVWTENGDYQPARVVRLGAIEEVEQGQLAASLEETSTAARQAAIDAGDHPDREGTQFVHEPAAPASSGTPVVGAGPVDAPEPTALGSDAARVPADGADALEPLSTSERDELNALRAAQTTGAERPAADPGRQTTPPGGTVTT